MSLYDCACFGNVEDKIYGLIAHILEHSAINIWQLLAVLLQLRRLRQRWLRCLIRFALSTHILLLESFIVEHSESQSLQLSAFKLHFAKAPRSATL
jgi:hypothetical protein